MYDSILPFCVCIIDLDRMQVFFSTSDFFSSRKNQCQKNQQKHTSKRHTNYAQVGTCNFVDISINARCVYITQHGLTGLHFHIYCHIFETYFVRSFIRFIFFL